VTIFTIKHTERNAEMKSATKLMRAVVKPGAVFGNQGDGYLNPRAAKVAAAVGRHSKGSPSEAAYAASGKHVFDRQIIRGK
jgi:hypothetical protein